jgi:hypothetical protein
VANTVIGDTVDKGVEKDEVLVVSTPSFEVKRALYIVIEAGWEPVLMTTFPVACANLHPSTESDNFVSFVNLSEGKSFVTVSRDGRPKFSREFFLEFGHSAAPEQSMDYQNIGEVEEEQLQNVIDERIVTELSRSFLYFKQFSRGETIRKAYLMGEHCGEALAKTVEDRFVIDVEPPEKLLAGQFDLQGDALPKAGEFDISLFTHLIGMAMKTSRKEEINLLPQEYVERKKRFLKRSFFYGAAAMYVLANLVLILDIEQLAPVIYKNRDYANRVYDLKRRAEESEAILRELDHPFKRWVECFGFISQVTPGTITYDELNILKGSDGYLWTLSGRTMGANPEKVQLEFNAFYSSLNKNPFLGKARYIPKKVYPVDGYRHKYEEKFVLELNMRGDVRD